MGSICDDSEAVGISQILSLTADAADPTPAAGMIFRWSLVSLYRKVKRQRFVASTILVSSILVLNDFSNSRSRHSSCPWLKGVWVKEKTTSRRQCRKMEHWPSFQRHGVPHYKVSLARSFNTSEWPRANLFPWKATELLASRSKATYTHLSNIAMCFHTIGTFKLDFVPLLSASSHRLHCRMRYENSIRNLSLIFNQIWGSTNVAEHDSLSVV